MKDYQEKTLFLLYNKYYCCLSKMATNILKNYFYSVPLEIADLINYSLAEFVRKYYYKFSPKYQISFQSFFLSKIKYSMLAYCAEFSSRKHQLLNNYIPYEEYLDKKDISRIIINYQCLDQEEKKLIEDMFEKNYDLETLSIENSLSIYSAKLKIKTALEKLKKHAYWLF